MITKSHPVRILADTRQAARKQLGRDSPRGLASDFIRPLDRLSFWLEEGVPLWLHVRVSSGTQNRSQSIHRQVWSTLAALTKRGLVVSGITREVSSGWKADDRPQWLEAVRCAKLLHAIIVGESTDRFVRPADYDPVHLPQATARVSDLEWLKYSAEGRMLATILDPDTQSSDVRSHQTRRGYYANKVEPGYKIRLREALLPHVRNLHRLGWTTHEIGEAIGLTQSTVFSWLQRQQSDRR